MRQSRLLLTWAAIHLLLIGAICAADIFALIRQGRTIIPYHSVSSDPPARTEKLGRPQQLLNLYLRSAGIEAGYSFFAPNVPDGYGVIFEVSYPDGRVDHQFAAAQKNEGDLRIASLMDQIAFVSSDQVRELMLQALTKAVWRQHPEALRVRAIFLRLVAPTLEQWSAGNRGNHEILYTCELSRSSPAPGFGNP